MLKMRSVIISILNTPSRAQEKKKPQNGGIFSPQGRHLNPSATAGMVLAFGSVLRFHPR
jgi:hypothetical protein